VWLLIFRDLCVCDYFCDFTNPQWIRLSAATHKTDAAILLGVCRQSTCFLRLHFFTAFTNLHLIVSSRSCIDTSSSSSSLSTPSNRKLP
jgi:hypothetical protein